MPGSQAGLKTQRADQRQLVAQLLHIPSIQFEVITKTVILEEDMTHIFIVYDQDWVVRLNKINKLRLPIFEFRK